MKLPPTPLTPARRAACTLLAAVAAVVAIPSAALAHVNARAVEISEDGVATVELSFDHGCQGRPTNALRVQIPSNVANVTPQPQPGWTVDTGEGQFGWSGGSVPDHQRITFTATMRVWGEAGETIWLKTVQECGELEEAWVEVPAPGAPEPENVAPSITLPRTIPAPVTITTTTALPPTSAPPSTLTGAAIAEESAPRNTGGLVVLGVAMVIILTGAVVLYLRHRHHR